VTTTASGPYGPTVVTFSPGSAPVQQSLGYAAQGVIVDNLTSSWLWLDDAQRFVPPWRWGVNVPLPGATYARLRWLNPPGGGLAVFPVDATQKLSATFVADALTPSDGFTVNDVGSPQTLVGEWATAGSGSNIGPTWSVPAGTQSLIIVCDVPANLTNLLVRAQLASSDPDASVGFAQLYDGVTPRGLDFVVVTWPGFAAGVTLVASTLGAGQEVNFWVLATPVAMATTPAAGTALKTASIAVASANGATTHIVGAGSAVTVYGWNLTVGPDATPGGAGSWAGVLLDSSGADVFGRVRSMVASAAGELSESNAVEIPQGLPLTAGAGIDLQTFSTGAGGNINVNGSVLYTQG
jgi:hypothetical protein